MRITERLNVEHGVFLRQLEDLDDLIRQGAPFEVLQAVVRSIHRAEGPHREIEDELLYPALAGALGTGFPPLVKIGAEHQEIESMAHAIASGSSKDPSLITKFAQALRQHVELEIHILLPLAEEWIPKDKLEAMCDWYREHAYERTVERATRWNDRWQA